ncbi:MAG: class I SAM-dependent methyltransferase [Promethearchaeota archaeon]
MEDHKLSFKEVLNYELQAYSGKNQLQLFWRRQRINFVLKNLERVHPESTRGEKIIADIGCGPGLVASMFARKGFSMRGIDHFKPFVDFANKEFEAKQYPGKFFLADICEDYPVFSEMKCDSIICIDSFEHFKEPRKAVSNFKKLLGNQGGHVILTMPNFKGSLFSIIERLWDDLAHTPGWKELHITRLNVNELATHFTEQGFTIEKIGTFLLASPFISMVNTKIARHVSYIENYFLKDVHWGFMIYMVARLAENEG